MAKLHFTECPTNCIFWTQCKTTVLAKIAFIMCAFYINKRSFWCIICIGLIKDWWKLFFKIVKNCLFLLFLLPTFIDSSKCRHLGTLKLLFFLPFFGFCHQIPLSPPKRIYPKLLFSFQKLVAFYIILSTLKLTL